MSNNLIYNLDCFDLLLVLMVFNLQILHVNRGKEFRFNLDNIYFRNCLYGDIAQVIYVNRATLPENYSKYTFLSLLRAYPDLFFVAIDEEESRVIAYMMNKIDTGYSLFENNKRVIKKGHVFSIGVLKEYRKRGIASALLALGFDAMMKRDAEEIFLEVRISNEPAIKLYEKFNMRIVDKIPYYYADGEAAYIMAVKTIDVKNIVNDIINYLTRNNKIREAI